MAKQNGETYAAFFSGVEKIQIRDGQIQLTVKNPFFADWAMDRENLAGLKNVLNSYVEMPAGIRISVISGEEQSVDAIQAKKAKQDKMARRFESRK